MSLKEIVDQLESCNFECEAGPLTNNVAFIKLKELAEAASGTTASDKKFTWEESKWDDGSKWG